jgi:two-component system sensor histidine kinase KdpD
MAAGAAVSLAVVGGMALQTVAELPNLAMVFLLAVLLCAFRFGMWSAIAASVLSFLAYNFFFIEPRYTLTVAEPHELFSLLIFLIVAGVTGSLAGRLREQADATRGRAEATQALFDFSRKLAGAATLDDIIWLLASQTAATTKGRSIILMEDGDGLSIKGGWPPEDEIATSDLAAARWAHDKREPAGRGTDTLPTAKFRFRPMIISSRVVAVVGVDPGDEGDPLPEDVDSALQAFVEQAAIAVERIMLVEDAAKARTVAEGEKLRAALLSSISHDLRTPLASIVGSVTSLRTLGDRMSAADRADLLATIEEEAERLSRFVSNLLDMTRLESGAIDIRRDWIDAGECVRSAIERARRTLPERRIAAKITGDLPLIRGDATLLHQAIFNLLDNAHKYSAASTAIHVEVSRSGGNILIVVTDEGIGIPREALERVFEKFYRVAGADGRAPGTGLGLAISAGIIHAMDGSITAESPVRGGRGTRMTVRLPIAEASLAAVGPSK